MLHPSLRTGHPSALRYDRRRLHPCPRRGCSPASSPEKDQRQDPRRRGALHRRPQLSGVERVRHDSSLPRFWATPPPGASRATAAGLNPSANCAAGLRRPLATTAAIATKGIRCLPTSPSPRSPGGASAIRRGFLLSLQFKGSTPSFRTGIDKSRASSPRRAPIASVVGAAVSEISCRRRRGESHDELILNEARSRGRHRARSEVDAAVEAAAHQDGPRRVARQTGGVRAHVTVASAADCRSPGVEAREEQRSREDPARNPAPLGSFPPPKPRHWRLAQSASDSG